MPSLLGEGWISTPAQPVPTSQTQVCGSQMDPPPPYAPSLPHLMTCPPPPGSGHMAVTLTQFPTASLFVGQSDSSGPLHPVTQQLPLCKFPLCPGEIPTASGPCGTLGSGMGWSQRQPVGSRPLLSVPDPQGKPLVLPACPRSSFSSLSLTSTGEGKELETNTLNM